MSALILFLAVALVGACLWKAVAKAVRIEFPQNADVQRHFVVAAVGSFILFAGFQLLIGYSGVLKLFDRLPPPTARYFLFNLTVCFVFAFSRIGTLIVKNISLQSLVGFHAFRFLAELVLLAAFHEGLAPVQMTLEGYQFDIVTAICATGLYFYLRKHQSRKLVLAFNFIGTAFLCVIAFIALTSMPTPMRLFMNEPSNVWVTGNPYILLPGILVVAAITGHILIYRKLKIST